MAYMFGNKGPFPNKAGEFYGNYHPGNLVLPENTRFGRPRPCAAAYVTVENGWVGLYLKKRSSSSRG